jgi:hypothetical protein
LLLVVGLSLAASWLQAWGQVADTRFHHPGTADGPEGGNLLDPLKDRRGQVCVATSTSSTPPQR